MYQYYIKRVFDIACALLAMIVFCWLYAIIAILVRIKLGNPVLFKQVRPGMKDRNGHEKMFTLYKFRTMTDEKDAEGNLLPDEIRLTRFGAWLRSTSLDELPEAINIIKGDMSVVGPRPQLVRDMVFMSDEQRMRHTVKPGLTGLAQVKGRNAVTWEEKLNWDLKYIEKISFLGDVRILFETIAAVLKKSGITDGENATALDYGDALLIENKVTKEKYDLLQESARNILIEYTR